MNNYISKKADIGSNVIFGSNIVINDNVKIGDNAQIGSYSEIGHPCKKEGTTIIGSNTKINSHSIVYSSVNIGDNCRIGHRVLIREETNIKSNSQIGSYSDLEGFINIDEYVKVHSNVHIGQFSTVKSFSWLFPYCILTNDPTPPSNFLEGPIINEFAIVATRSTLLPSVSIGFGSFVGANSLVNRDVPMETIASGNPLIIKGNISRIKLPKTKKSAYPWALRYENNFYPKDLSKRYEVLRAKYF